MSTFLSRLLARVRQYGMLASARQAASALTRHIYRCEMRLSLVPAGSTFDFVLVPSAGLRQIGLHSNESHFTARMTVLCFFTRFPHTVKGRI